MINQSLTPSIKPLDDNENAMPFQGFAQRFAYQVHLNPTAPAVSDATTVLSYAELERQANCIARCLQQYHVSRNDRVIVLAERTAALLPMIIAILKVGATYVPLDFQLGFDRFRQVSDQIKPAVILTTIPTFTTFESHLGLIGKKQAVVPVLLYEEIIRDSESHSILVPIDPDQCAYIIYTSGSTGIPKGAMVHYAGMQNHLESKIQTLQLTNSDCVGQTSPHSFDFSLWQLLAILLVGGQCRIIPDSIVYNPQSILDYLAASSITIYATIPSMLFQIVDRLHPSMPISLRCLICAGEILPPPLVNQWLAVFPSIPILNSYGPTECSDIVLQAWIDQPLAHDTLFVPIGYPINNCSAYILDTTGQTARQGSIGNLYLGGMCVGLGYYENKERTQKAFSSDPYNGNQWMYETGDLARQLPSGAIEFIGRANQLVQRNNITILLSQIEMILYQHPAVAAAAVIQVDTRPPDDLIIAYVVPKDNEVLNEDVLRIYLSEANKAYYIPDQWVWLTQMPITRHGKLNRRLLKDAHLPLVTKVTDAYHKEIQY